MSSTSNSASKSQVSTKFSNAILEKKKEIAQKEAQCKQQEAQYKQDQQNMCNDTFANLMKFLKDDNKCLEPINPKTPQRDFRFSDFQKCEQYHVFEKTLHDNKIILDDNSKGVDKYTGTYSYVLPLWKIRARYSTIILNEEIASSLVLENNDIRIFD